MSTQQRLILGGYRSVGSRHGPTIVSGGGGGGPVDPPPVDSNLPGPTVLDGKLSSYTALAGDQLVVVPNGTLSGGAADIFDAHPVTTGRFQGRLILVAQSHGGVTVDLSQYPTTRRLYFQTACSGITFIGFNFLDGIVWNQGTRIHFWYCDWQNFDDHYMQTTDNQRFNRLGSGGRPTNVVHNADGSSNYLRGDSGPPRPMVNAYGVANCQWYGCDFHHTLCTTVYGWNQSNLIFQGCRVYDIDHYLDTPGDAGVDSLSHIVPGPSSPPGGHHNIQILDHYMEDTYILMGTNSGSCDGMYWERLDHFNCNPSPLLLGSAIQYRMLNINRTDARYVRADGSTSGSADPGIYSQAHPNGSFGPFAPANSTPDVIFADHHVLQSSSPQFLAWNTGILTGITSKVGARSWTGLYANVWRAANPYESAFDFLAIPGYTF